jgi:photosystem II stability/assembly factor-like uncharacterized protein
MKTQFIKSPAHHPCARTFNFLAGFLLCLTVAHTAQAAPVGDALYRPAAQSRNAARSVLLAAAKAGSRLVTVGERGIVMLSDDKGKTWRQASTPVSVTLVAIHFANSKTGYVVGHGGTVLLTNDGGETWTRRLDGRRMAELVLAEAQKSGHPASIKSAERMVADGADKPLLDVLAFDEKNVLVIGAYGLAFASNDSGQTWQSQMSKIDNPKGLHLYSMRANENRVVIAGEQGILLSSTDQGKSFQKLDSPYKGSFFTVELPNEKTILLAGLRGNVWQSKDNGKRWEKIQTRQPVNVTGSALQRDGSIALVDQSGSVTLLQGGQITAIETPMQPPINGVVALPEGGLLTVGIQGAFVLPSPSVNNSGASK